MPTVQFGKRPGRTRGRPEDRATADGAVSFKIANTGVDVVADVQTVTSDGTGGTFTLATAGDVTGTIAWNATIGTVETAIETLDEYTAATVTGSAGAWVITSNDGAGLPGETLVVDNTLLTGGTAVNVHTTTGVANVNETVEIVRLGDTSTFTLSYGGQTTGVLDETTSAAQLEVALELLSTITAVTVTGSGTRKDPFSVLFVTPQGDATAFTANLGTWSSTVVVAARQVGPGDRE